MSMTETPAPAEKPKRKYQRKNRVAAKPAAVPSEFAGMSPTDCCDGCGPKHCVISGIGVCAHPFKGGLQAELRGDAKAMSRYLRAKEALGEAKISTKGG